MFINDASFSQEIKAAGGRLLNRSFKLGLLDLICPSIEFILNSSTNKCGKKFIISKSFSEVTNNIYFEEKDEKYKPNDSHVSNSSLENHHLNKLVPNENENTYELQKSTIAIRSFIHPKKFSKTKNSFKTLIVAHPKKRIFSQVT